MKTIVRSIEGETGHELFITVVPDAAQSLAEQALAFAAIRQLLDKHHAWICQERIYAPADGIPMLIAARAAHYGNYDDGVSPAWLVGGPEPVIRGIQIYAVESAAPPRALAVNGHQCARMISRNGCRWITASSLPIHPAATPEAQTRQAFDQAEALLQQAGGDLQSIARTWFNLDDILQWYPRFNDTRSKFFTERGLLQPGNNARLPASTGIGVSPANKSRVLMDMFAVIGNGACPAALPRCLCKHQATGHQRSAFNYGSSFARAATACTPAGRTVFVSGTAAIDPQGQTCHLGDIPGQIRMTLDCLSAVLRDQQCAAGDVVQAIAYCKTAAVEKCFQQFAEELPWPWITVRGDICRDDLLFEGEVTACRASRP